MSTRVGIQSLRKSTLPLPDIAPGKSGRIALELPSNRDADVISRSESTIQQGRELWTWTWPIQKFSASHFLCDSKTNAKPQVSELPDSLASYSG